MSVKLKNFENSAFHNEFEQEMAVSGISAGKLISVAFMVMELAMIFYGALKFDLSKIVYQFYFSLYFAMFLVGVSMFLFCLYMTKRVKQHVKFARIMTNIFCCLSLVWSASIGVLDAVNGYQPITFLAFLMGFTTCIYTHPKEGIPIFVGVNLYYWILAAIFTDVVLDLNLIINYITYFIVLGISGAIHYRQKKNAVKSNIALRTKTEELNEMVTTLNSLNDQLEKETVTDKLTGVMNRWAFDKSFKDTLSDCRQLGTPISAIMYDLDSFKYINDLYGHSVGDDILKVVAKKLIRFAGYHHVFRYGGEEFVVLLSGEKALNAANLANLIREDIASDVYTEKKIPITVSGGIFISKNLIHLSDDKIMVLADKALYKAKNNGKNCVVVCDETGEYF